MIYGLLSFLGAFLLFSLEPMFGKALTPRFGGGAQVWVVCLVFFQATLLLGYAYAHILETRVPPRWRLRAHAAVLACAVAAMAWHWVRGGDPLLSMAPEAEHPLTGLLGALIGHAALPLACLSSTSPLLQAWRGRRSGASAYRLYAWSNLGSFTGLLAYPFLVEPWLPLSMQAKAQAALFLAYTAGMVWIGRASAEEGTPSKGQESSGNLNPGSGRLWLLSSAGGAFLLTAMTCKLTSEVVTLPLLWIVPLACYLLSFVLIFDGRWGLERGGWPVLWSVVFLLCAGVVLGKKADASALYIATLCLSVFAGSMVCHGFLFACRPGPERLTAFYLSSAGGGALGGAFAALVGPFLFDRFFEPSLSVLVVALLILLMFRKSHGVARMAGAMAAVGAMVLGMWGIRREQSMPGRFERNFYGVVRVVKFDHAFAMDNLKTVHGYWDPLQPRNPGTYYTAEGGMGRAIRLQMSRRPAIRVGVVGLGIGSLGLYARPKDHFVFYEINPAVVALAEPGGLVPLMGTLPVPADIRTGDGRLLLDQEGRRGEAPFDVLVVDAFTGDAVPWHLLTREAFKVYLARLAPGGILAVHVSNPLAVDRAVLAQAKDAGLYGAYLVDRSGSGAGQVPLAHMKSLVLLMSREASTLQDGLVAETMILGFGPKTFRGEGRDSHYLTAFKGDLAWTDDRSDASGLMFRDRVLDEVDRVKRVEAASLLARPPLAPRSATPSAP